MNDMLQLIKEMRPFLKKGDVAGALLHYIDATIKAEEAPDEEELPNPGTSE